MERGEGGGGAWNGAWNAWAVRVAWAVNIFTCDAIPCPPVCPAAVKGAGATRDRWRRTEREGGDSDRHKDGGRGGQTATESDYSFLGPYIHGCGTDRRTEAGTRSMPAGLGGRLGPCRTMKRYGHEKQSIRV